MKWKWFDAPLLLTEPTHWLLFKSFLIVYDSTFIGFLFLKPETGEATEETRTRLNDWSEILSFRERCKLGILRETSRFLSLVWWFSVGLWSLRDADDRGQQPDIYDAFPWMSRWSTKEEEELPWSSSVSVPTSRLACVPSSLPHSSLCVLCWIVSSERVSGRVFYSAAVAAWQSSTCVTERCFSSSSKKKKSTFKGLNITEWQ